MWTKMRNARSAKALFLAGVMLCGTGAAECQQEVNPDHFDGTDAKPVQKTRPTATKHKPVTVAMASSRKSRKARVKKSRKMVHVASAKRAF